MDVRVRVRVRVGIKLRLSRHLMKGGEESGALDSIDVQGGPVASVRVVGHVGRQHVAHAQDPRQLHLGTDR